MRCPNQDHVSILLNLASFQVSPPQLERKSELFEKLTPCNEEAHDKVSHSSSVFVYDDEANVTVDDVNGPTNEDYWGNLNKRGKDSKIGNRLKHMGNVKRRKMSKLIWKDMLGRDGVATLKDLKKNRQKTLARDK